MSDQIGRIRVDRVDVNLLHARDEHLRVVHGNTRVEYTMGYSAPLCYLKLQKSSSGIQVQAGIPNASYGGDRKWTPLTSIKSDCKPHVIECKERKGDDYAVWTITAHKNNCRCKR